MGKVRGHIHIKDIDLNQNHFKLLTTLYRNHNAMIALPFATSSHVARLLSVCIGYWPGFVKF